MLINTEELKNNLDNLNQLISDYEELHLNMYSNMSSTFFSWNDNYSKKFLIYAEDDKKSFSQLLSNYKSLSDIYSYLFEKYSKFGKIIYYELDNKNDIYENFNKYISKLENIITKYDNSNLINNSNFSYKIYSERKRLNDNLDKVRSIYSDVKEFYESIEEININVNDKISKLEVYDVQEISINDYV